MTNRKTGKDIRVKTKRANDWKTRATARATTPKIPKLQPLERDIAKLVTDYLEYRGWLVVRTEANAVRRGTRSANRGGIVAIGEPDARAFCGDHVLHLEFKRPTGVLSAAQKQRHAYLETFGITVHVVRSLEDTQAILKAFEEQYANR
jgi:hypothetical protein